MYWQCIAGLRVTLRGALLRMAPLHQAGKDGRAGRVRGARPPDDGAQRDGHADGEQGLDGSARRHIHRWVMKHPSLLVRYACRNTPPSFLSLCFYPKIPFCTC